MWNLYELIFRVSALLTSSIFLLDIEIFLLIQTLLFLHINMGFVNIINDYIHIKTIKLIYIFLVRILIIEMLRCSLELLL